jgi:hypothetical protein
VIGNLEIFWELNMASVPGCISENLKEHLSGKSSMVKAAASLRARSFQLNPDQE